MPAKSVSLGFVKEIGGLSQDSVTVDMFAQNSVLTLSEWEFLARLKPVFLNTDDDDDDAMMSSNNGDGDNLIGRAEDPLSFRFQHPHLSGTQGAMVAKGRDEEVERRSRNAMPR